MRKFYTSRPGNAGLFFYRVLLAGFYRSLLAGTCCAGALLSQGQGPADSIPLGGNAWSSAEKGGRIDSNGIVGWTDSAVWFDTWLRVTATGDLHVWIYGSAPGRSRVQVGLKTGHGKDTVLEMSGKETRRYDAGIFTIRDTGYQCIRIRGISRTGDYFAEIPAILVLGTPLNDRTAFVPNNEGNFFHWGRRGPSVHLNYFLPAGDTAEWFYNEVKVPEGQDVQGSYFMACGFAQGYFGMQVNSPTERHILFSVWSPFETNDPAAIPDSQRILLLQKGDGVHAGVFGSEGSGGQSYLNYPWKAGRYYRFLLHAKPAGRGYTEFTAWFYAPEEGHWRLIAGFGRPQTQSWLTNLHSFLENFEPEQGMRERYVQFRQEWIRNPQGRWIPLGKARFTVDNTGRKGYRMDYAGGWKNDGFYLRNGGFFNDYTPAGTWLQRVVDGDGRGPDIGPAGPLQQP
jgi:hypothetical protein